MVKNTVLSCFTSQTLGIQCLDHAVHPTSVLGQQRTVAVLAVHVEKNIKKPMIPKNFLDFRTFLIQVKMALTKNGKV